MTLLDRIAVQRPKPAPVPEWLRRQQEGRLPAKDFTRGMPR